MVIWNPEANDLFLKALEIARVDERRKFLDSACAGDAILRDRVAALLEADERAGSFLESPALSPTVVYGDRAGDFLESPALPPTSLYDCGPHDESPGATVGPYKLLEQIGEGGMGRVFMAEQTRPVRRRVALKVIKPGMDTRQVVARFEAERQALALMDHPNIARVLDGGATDEGRPYFVMELVRGIPITDYCDREGLSIRERLELFVLVCRAVQHAHQKGVIHRDLKPSNVMVTVIDGAAVPKVIDFGVAKATGQVLTDRTLHTGFHQMVGTPLYMSPEQADLSGMDVDTRSDVYSLGVLLYELLTGATPFDRETFGKAAFDEMRRIIREDEPPKPSTRLGALGERLTTVSARRKADPRQLSRAVRGELDWIAMKALEKDRRRRYATAHDLAADVMRQLTDRPVEACPPSAWYRFGKFARRNRAASAVVATVATAILLAVAGLAAGLLAVAGEQAKTAAAYRAEARQRQRARRAVDEMYTQVAEKWLAGDGRLTPLQREFLEKALAFYEEFAAEEGDDAGVRHEAAKAATRVGEIRHQLGLYDEAFKAHRRAIDAYRALAADSPDRPEYRRGVARSLQDAGDQLVRLGRTAEAERALRESVALRERLVADRAAAPDDRRNLAAGLRVLSALLGRTGRFAEAEPIAQRAVEMLDRPAGRVEGDPAGRKLLAAAEVNLGVLYAHADRWPDAVRHHRLALGLRQRLAAEDPADPEARMGLAQCYFNLGEADRLTQRPEEAAREYSRALPIIEKLVADHPDRPAYREMQVMTLNLLAEELGRHRPEEVRQVLLRALAAAEALMTDFSGVPDYRRRVAHVHGSLGALYARQGRNRAARDALERAFEHTNRLAGDFPERSDYRQNLAAICYSLAVNYATFGDPKDRDPARALELARQAVRLTPGVPGNWKALALAEYRAGDFDAALAAETKALELRQGSSYEYDWLLLALIHFGRGDRELARTWYHRVCSNRDAFGHLGGEQDLRRLGDEATPLLRSLEPEGPEDLLRARQWQLDKGRRIPGPENLWLHWELEKVADVLAAMGRDERAVALFEESRRMDPDRYARGCPFGPWSPLAMLKLRMGDEAGFRELCREALRRFEADDHAVVAEQVARLCTLLPGTVDEPDRARALARRAVEADPENPWTLLARGLAESRVGLHREAAATLAASLERHDLSVGRAQAALGLALAHGRLGQAEDARRALAEADRALADEPTEVGPDCLLAAKHWREWLVARTLAREAEPLRLDLAFPADPFTLDSPPDGVSRTPGPSLSPARAESASPG